MDSAHSHNLPARFPPFASPQRGVASGWLGGLSMLGYLAGGLLSYHIGSTGIFGAYMVLIFVHGVAMAITCYTIPEGTPG